MIPTRCNQRYNDGVVVGIGWTKGAPYALVFNNTFVGKFRSCKVSESGVVDPDFNKVKNCVGNLTTEDWVFPSVRELNCLLKFVNIYNTPFRLSDILIYENVYFATNYAKVRSSYIQFIQFSMMSNEYTVVNWFDPAAGLLIKRIPVRIE